MVGTEGGHIPSNYYGSLQFGWPLNIGGKPSPRECRVSPLPSLWAEQLFSLSTLPHYKQQIVLQAQGRGPELFLEVLRTNSKFPMTPGFWKREMILWTSINEKKLRKKIHKQLALGLRVLRLVPESKYVTLRNFITAPPKASSRRKSFLRTVL